VSRLGQLFAAAIFLFACGSIESYAATLTGDVISAQYYYPTTSHLYSSANPLQNADPSIPNPLSPVGAGEEGALLVETHTNLHFDFDVSKLVITLDTVLSNPTWLSVDPTTQLPVTQNGPRFQILNGPATSTSFISIASVVASNGQTVSAFLANPNLLFVNWAGMNYHNGDTVTITFGPGEGPAPAPLPAALPMFVGGLGALGFLGWKRKRQRARG
jgi:hypothetical protein